MADNKTVKERLKLFISNLNISEREFEGRCCLSYGYIHSMRKGIGQEKLDTISNIFPELNLSWLMFGEGEMLKNEKKDDVEEKNIISIENVTDQIEILRGMQANMNTLFNTVDRQNKTIDNLTDTVTRQNETISGLTATVSKQNETISSQQRQISELEAKKETTTKSGVVRATTLNVGEMLK